MEVETRDWSPGVRIAESSREKEVSGRAGSGALRCRVFLACHNSLGAE